MEFIVNSILSEEAKKPTQHVLVFFASSIYFAELLESDFVPTRITLFSGEN